MRSGAAHRSRGYARQQDLFNEEKRRAQKKLRNLERSSGSQQEVFKDKSQARNAAQLQRLKGKQVSSDSSKSKRYCKSTQRKAPKDASLPGTGTKEGHFQPVQRQEPVIVTLPHPKLVSPHRGVVQAPKSVPPLLSVSAQEALARVQHQSKKAPLSPGEEEDELNCRRREMANSSSAQDRAFRIQQASKYAAAVEHGPTDDYALRDPHNKLYDSRDLEEAPQKDDIDKFKRISNFHIEVSESFSPSDSEDDAYKQTIPSVQLDPRNIMICIGSFIVVMVIGLGAWLSPSSAAKGAVSSDELPPAATTLEAIRQRGYVICGINHYNHSMYNAMSDDLHGFNIELCRAMAMIALGDALLYEQVWVHVDSRFELLANETVDIIADGTTFTMGSDVYESNTKTAFTFTRPYFYAELMIAGDPEYVDCLEAEVVKGVNMECQGLRVCSVNGSRHQETLLDVLNGVTIVPNESAETMESRIEAGVCNVVAAEPLFLAQSKEMFGDQAWKLGTKVLSSVPQSHVTRQDDPEWSTLVDLAINAFVIAKNRIAPQQLALDVVLGNGHNGSNHNGSNHPHGNAFETLISHLIMEFEDYGTYYERHVEALIPPGLGMNKVYGQDASTGLLLSYPFGNVNGLGPGPVFNGTLHIALKRGYLVCGVMPSRGLEFASTAGMRADAGMDIKSIHTEGATEWMGFDVEVCRGVAASLFGGEGNKIAFVDLQEEEQPYRALASGKVDVVAGARVTLQAMYEEPTSRESFSFSSPYYYNNESHDAFALMTLQADTQWSDYCFWIVMGIIHAEEKNIAASNSTEMPQVNLFGEFLGPMLMHSVGFTGNYGEIYNNTLEAFIPRSGANMLNDGSGPQQFSFPIR